MKIFWLKLLFLFFLSSFAFALSPEEKLADEAQEQRAMKLFLEVRCLVCNGQVIENSDTEFSFQMRKLIRQKIAGNKSDQEIKAELVKEFGEDILTEPQNLSKFILWFLPVFFAVVALVFALSRSRYS